MIDDYRVSSGKNFQLTDHDPAKVGEWTKSLAKKRLAENADVIGKLAYRLYAENSRALLLVLQGMDTAGKDGTIRSVLHQLCPQSCQVVPFKQPSVEELDHDFLWRIHRAIPARGNVGIFNRSHYEDVLIVRVHNLVPKSTWQSRYTRINEFEKLVRDGGVHIIKCFLHISNEEQKERLQARLDNPEKRWKFSKADVKERSFWNDYQDAYQDAIAKCASKHAPWYVVPSDRKWYRNLVVSEIVRHRLEEMSPQFPPCEDGLDDVEVI